MIPDVQINIRDSDQKPMKPKNPNQKWLTFGKNKE
jgi:hypothetical protein